MRAAIRENLAPQRVVLEEHDDLTGRLRDLEREGMNKNSRHTGRKTTVVNRVVRFRERIRVSAEGRLGSFILRLTPSCHGRLLDVELINPIWHRSGRWVVQHPDPRKVRCLARMRGFRRTGRLFVLSGHRRRMAQYDRERK